MTQRPSAAFVGVTYAGWGTRQQNLRRHVREDGRLDGRFHSVTGWREGGLIERLPFAQSVAGRLRALEQARGLATLPRPDVVWTSSSELALPYLWSFVGPLDRPMVIETDWTFEQQEAFAPAYFGRPPRRGLRRFAGELQERLTFQRAAAFVALSNWAAAGLERAGVPRDAIHVIHPGVDLDAWEPGLPETAGEGPLRVLFVGGDFKRKGGDLLVESVRGPLAGRCELDIVTRDQVQGGPGIRVHRAEANSPELRALYARAEVFAMPTRAECFGMVSVEALASGLPVIVGNSGGVADVVDHGVTGWLIEQSPAGVRAALEHALAIREHLPSMGRRARAAAETRFDGRRNDRRLIDLMLDLAEQSRVRRQKRGAA